VTLQRSNGEDERPVYLAMTPHQETRLGVGLFLAAYPVPSPDVQLSRTVITVVHILNTSGRSDVIICKFANHPEHRSNS
jgi:hypothetical protein